MFFKQDSVVDVIIPLTHTRWTYCSAQPVGVTSSFSYSTFSLAIQRAGKVVYEDMQVVLLPDLLPVSEQEAWRLDLITEQWNWASTLMSMRRGGEYVIYSFDVYNIYIYIIYSKYKYECIVHFDWFCLWAFTALTAYLKASKMVNDPSSGMAKQKIQGNVLFSSEKSEPAQASQLHFRLPSFAFSPLLRTFVNLLLYVLV